MLLRQISFRWSAAHINGKFGWAGEMDFGDGTLKSTWILGTLEQDSKHYQNCNIFTLVTAFS